jgi:ribulose-phosphate 3-epimerase
MKAAISASLMCADLLNLQRDLAELAEARVEYLHFDIMDGHYVPNLCFPIGLVAELRNKYPSVLRDIHLMVTDPMAYLPRLAEAGADYVSFHLDATNFSRRTLTAIRDLGMKSGLVINPSQRIDLLEPLIPFLDYVVLMTVEPGYAGQRFMVDSLPRVTKLVELRKKYNADFLISIDGGVDMENAIECAKRGAEIFVTGIYTVFRQPDDISSACKRFRMMLTRL